MTERGRWQYQVRLCDMVAALFWAAAAVLLVVATVSTQSSLAPWCMAMVVLGAMLTVVTWASRRFDRLDGEAFDRGLRAGMGMGGGAPVEELPRRR